MSCARRIRNFLIPRDKDEENDKALRPLPQPVPHAAKIGSREATVWVFGCVHASAAVQANRSVHISTLRDKRCAYFCDPFLIACYS
ncbi:MAG: hypothetical protein K0Q70_47 [Rhodospirillales bacterium]|jgi:hypothetical protein|nr:hypothetical protein [Rhodospirillales bacterium]